MPDAHRIRSVLDKLAEKTADAVKPRAKTEKGKSHEFPSHQHDAIAHSHGHSHVVHYRVPGERDEWRHLTTTHEHLHDHASLTHLHAPHQELGFEHVHEAHHHDHGEQQ
jgi:hypothetical protein